MDSRRGAAGGHSGTCVVSLWLMGRIRTQHCASFSCTARAMSTIHIHCYYCEAVKVVVTPRILSLFVSPWQIKWLSASGQPGDCRAAALCNWAQCQHSVSSPTFAVQADCYCYITWCYMLHAAADRNIKQLTCAECGWIYLYNLWSNMGPDNLYRS